MRPSLSARCLNALILLLTLALSSCGGGTNTAGAGGSGIGGTGITTVSGNISYVVALSPQDELTPAAKLLAGTLDWLAGPVIAQDQNIQLGGVQVFGGGQSTTTDESGNFVLEDVTPSDHFVLNFVLEENETVTLPIGSVPAGTRVTVNDIVVNADQGFANAGSVEIEENTGSSAGSNGNSARAPRGAGNNNATGASANSNENSSETANNASNNNQANNAGNGANANPNANK